jgi:hypothetical protein
MVEWHHAGNGEIQHLVRCLVSIPWLGVFVANGIPRARSSKQASSSDDGARKTRRHEIMMLSTHDGGPPSAREICPPNSVALSNGLGLGRADIHTLLPLLYAGVRLSFVSPRPQESSELVGASPSACAFVSNSEILTTPSAWALTVWSGIPDVPLRFVRSIDAPGVGELPGARALLESFFFESVIPPALLRVLPDRCDDTFTLRMAKSNICAGACEARTSHRSPVALPALHSLSR